MEETNKTVIVCNENSKELLENELKKESRKRIGVIGHVGHIGTTELGALSLSLSAVKDAGKDVILIDNKPEVPEVSSYIDTEAMGYHRRYESMITKSHPPYIRPTEKISRNAQCPCGSGKKYKRCCINKN